MRGTRGRLTLGDVVMLFATMAFMSPLVLVFVDSLGEHAGQLRPGAVWVWRVVPGLAFLVLIAVIFVTSVGGVSR